MQEFPAEFVGLQKTSAHIRIIFEPELSGKDAELLS
jgi:hypothetical protein